MPQLPPLGARVSLRYRLPTDEARPFTDVVGHVEQVEPAVAVRTRHGEVVTIRPGDVVAVRVVPEQPVRAGAIRNLEHAAALAWPGTEQRWHDGWFLRFGGGATRRANSAVPLLFTSHAEIAAVAEQYAARGLPALISAPDRLFRIPGGVPTDAENLVMTTDIGPGGPADAGLTAEPDDRWLTLYERDVPPAVLTAVVDGEVGFGTLAGAAVGRVAITEAPDGTRWAGVSAVHVVKSARRQGLARRLCEDLLGWAGARGATRAYVQVVSDNDGARRLYEQMGFTLHHRSRYVRAEDLL
ncbi:GNAT family N-acetyltransferase [Mycolicibacterium sp. 018/SC-01/001]|uniref:N-acetylglutamate synthase, CG3035 family n=1 Tax=Mycolicibacterium sp. 018/SC-01/001 TaxID=2592069 RepID=UPI0011800915|nr:GNAT family N-acetyltransferase [Mycolicibacterium sp. 018/SC-01/001]TRW82756.1 GNAT family N-acetyltransferase [Mycolicibacterium sp. 018/SC-01/001]